jgi:hypothetical protein
MIYEINTKLKYISQNFAKFRDILLLLFHALEISLNFANFKAKFRKIHSGEIIRTKMPQNLATFTSKHSLRQLQGKDVQYVIFSDASGLQWAPKV